MAKHKPSHPQPRECGGCVIARERSCSDGGCHCSWADAAAIRRAKSNHHSESKSARTPGATAPAPSARPVTAIARRDETDAAAASTACGNDANFTTGTACGKAESAATASGRETDSAATSTACGEAASATAATATASGEETEPAAASTACGNDANFTTGTACGKGESATAATATASGDETDSAAACGEVEAAAATCGEAESPSAATCGEVEAATTTCGEARVPLRRHLRRRRGRRHHLRPGRVLHRQIVRRARGW